VLADETAATRKRVNAMLRQLAPAAVANAKREAADLQAMIDAEQKAKGQPTFKLAAVGLGVLQREGARSEKYNFDESQLKPYFEMKNVLENGVFFAATKLYGITFKERTDLPKYHPDTWIYDVFDADGSSWRSSSSTRMRASKRGGAWMNTYVSQSGLTGDKPVVANHLNIPKPPAGKPTLMTWDEVTTTFHEFGHALHGMFSDVRYPYFSDQRAARLRRVPVAGQRDVGRLAERAGQLRQALPDRRADAAGAAGQGDRRVQVQPGLRHHRVPGRRDARPALAPVPAPTRSRPRPA
jgi:peptidyl-dipeptidase Dcp